MVTASPAQASPGTTFTVDSGLDAVDANPGDGRCETASGVCTLRAAIQEANTTAATDEIDVTLDVTLSIAGTGEDAAATGDLDVNEPVIIKGQTTSFNGRAKIDGARLDRIFDVRRTTTAADLVTLFTDGLDLVNGDATAAGTASFSGPDDPERNGSGVRAIGTDVHLTNSSIASSGAELSGEGGGVYHRRPGTLVLTSVTLNDNFAQRGGSVSSDDLVFSDSVAASSDAYVSRAEQGGGIYVAPGGRADLALGEAYGGTQAVGAQDGGGTYVATGAFLRVGTNGYSVAGLAYQRGGMLFVASGATADIAGKWIGSAGNEGGAVYAEQGATVRVHDAEFAQNSAGVGGAIANHGDLTVERTRFLQAQTLALGGAGGGGAIYNGPTGTVQATNTLFLHNLATPSAGGGGIHLQNDGVARLSFVTAIDGAADTRYPENAGFPFAGIATGAGGTTELRASVLAGTAQGYYLDGGPAPDCGGTLRVEVTSIVTAPGAGCTVATAAGASSLQVDPDMTRSWNLASPSAFSVPNAGSPALDVLPLEQCEQISLSDQRGFIRPANSACDLGSYEEGAADGRLLVSTTISNPTVDPGATVVPVESIDPVSLRPTENTTSDPVTNPSLAAVPLRSIDLSRPIGAGLVATPLRSIALAALPLRSIPLRSIPLRSIPLRSIAWPGGWQQLVAGPNNDGPLANRPLSTITLEDAFNPDLNPNIDALTDPADRRAVKLADLDLSASPLRSITLAAIALGATPLRSIPLRSIDVDAVTAWCAAVREAGVPGVSCEDGTVDPATSTLLSLTLQGVPLRSIPVAATPLRSIDLEASPLRSIGLESIDLTATPLRSIPLRSIPLRSIPLRSIPLRSIGDASVLGKIVDCTSFNCADPGNRTLGDLEGSDLLIGSLGDLTVFNGTTIGDLVASAADALGDTALGDVLIGLLPRSDYPWQTIDLDAAALAGRPGAKPGTTVGFTVTVDMPPTPTGRVGFVRVGPTLPTGWIYKPGSAKLDGLPLEDPVGVLAWDFPVITAPRFTITFDAYPALETGSSFASAGATGVFVFNNSTTETIEARGAALPTSVKPSFEPNDTPAQATSLPPDNLVLSQIQSAGDVDLYALDVPNGASVSLSLSNLPVDLDLRLYAPGGGGGTLRQAPQQLLVPQPDDGVDPVASSISATVQSDIPLQDRPVYATSSKRGTENEQIDTPALSGGTWLVQVSGYNLAASGLSYSLRAKVLAAGTAPPCSARSYATTDDPSVYTPADRDDSVNTVMLVNPGRLGAAYGPDAATSVMTALDDFATDATRFGTVAQVVPVDAYPAVRDAYAAWEATNADGQSNRCEPAAANAVVTAIGGVLDDLQGRFPNLHNVVIVGADDQIPFARVADGTKLANEREYAATFQTSNEVSSAFRNGFVLTDDPYGQNRPVAVGDRALYTPRLSVGRLVESPASIERQLSSFISAGGRLERTSSAVSGYEFLQDGARRVADALDSLRDPGSGPTTRLISDEWTAEDLRQLIVGKPNVASINGHFDHYRALPADQSVAGVQTDLVSIDDLATIDVADNGQLDASALRGAVLFSMGCHGGLSVPRMDGTADEGIEGDWAEALMNHGAAVWAANTGFGYGDSDVVAVSEALMSDFAESLDGTRTIGDAMVRAKQTYAGGLATLTPYDEKVVAEVAFYGLPMYRLGEDRTPSTGPEPLPTRTDPATNLVVADLDLHPSFTRNDGSRGSWWTVDGQGTVQTVNSQPLLPTMTLDLTQPSGTEARGVVLTGVDSTDVADVDPVIFRPTVVLAADEPEPLIDGTAFPSSFGTVRHLQLPEGDRQQAVLVPAQFLANARSASSIGTQRLFTGVRGTVLYAPPGSTDRDAPVISSVKVTAPLDRPDDRSLTVGAVDVGADDRNDGMAEVVVLWTSADAPGTWESFRLTRSAYGTFTAPLPATRGDIVMYVQAVDAAGNVAVSSDRGALFSANALTDQRPPTVSLSTTAVPTSDGWYPKGTKVQVTAEAGASTVRSITARAGVAPAINGLGTTLEVPLESPGEVTVTATARDVAGRTSTPASQTYKVDLLGPTITCFPPGVRWLSASTATVRCTASDSQSGLADDSQSGFTLTAELPAGSRGGRVPTGTLAVADRAGNVATAGPVTVGLDPVPPTITIQSPVNGQQVLQGTSGRLVYTCSDEASGIAACYSLTGDALDTSTPGTKTAYVVAGDFASNYWVETVTYEVLPVTGASSFVRSYGDGITPGTRSGKTTPVTITPSSDPLGSFAFWTNKDGLIQGARNREGQIGGRLTITDVGTTEARGVAVMVGARVRTAPLDDAYSVQFDPGYTCPAGRAPGGNGSRRGALVIIRWNAGAPILNRPVACTPVPTDFYPSLASAEADSNRAFWLNPQDYKVTVRPGVAPNTYAITGTLKGPRPNGTTRTIRVQATVGLPLGYGWGLRSWGDLTGTMTATVKLGPA